MELAWNRLTRQRRDGGEGEDRRESKRWKAEEKGIRGGGIDRNRSGGRGGRALTIGRGGGAAWRGASAPIVLSTN